MSEKLFRVRWEIDLEAPTPVDAARAALAIQRDPDSIATFFEVRRHRPDGTMGRRHHVDLTFGPGCEPEGEPLMGRESSAPDNVSISVPDPDPESSCVRTRVVDGVTYKAVPEVKSHSCTGCVANIENDSTLCTALYPDEEYCYSHRCIWVVSESEPETPPPPKRGTVRDPDNGSEFLQCDDPIVDGVLYRAVDALPGEECEGCAGGAYGTSLCSDLPCCGSGGRDDSRSVIFVEVKK